jgi:outer membrane lipoprotein carrier protein
VIRKLSAVSCQLSAKKLVIFILLLLAALFTFSLSLDTAVTASDDSDKGTLIIPKRPGDSKQASKWPADVDETVEAIQEKLAGMNDIKGMFSQTSYIRDLEETQEYSGTFFIKKPSSMMWEYAAPRDEKVVIKDTDTWIYKKSQNQVIKTTFSKEAYSQVPIALLGSLENIKIDFDITMPQKNALQLIPKRKMGFIKTLLLETIHTDFPIKMFTIFDTYGNIIMIELADVQPNPGLDDSLFIFKPPPGAEVFDMSQ